jgi:hypothetical protein
MFSFFDSTKKTVTVKVPSGATGYASSLPATFTGSDSAANWGNGFRGGGWNGSAFVVAALGSEGTIGGAGWVDSNITLTIETQQ